MKLDMALLALMVIRLIIHCLTDCCCIIECSYHPRMRVGNGFGHVCLSVFLSVCLSMFLSVQDITFEPLDIETSFLVCRYILTYLGQVSVSRSLGQGQGHMRKNDNFTYFNLLILSMWPKVINKVKVTHQGEGHFKVKVKISSSLPTFCKILLILTY